jgi:hypothetical protein
MSVTKDGNTDVDVSIRVTDWTAKRSQEKAGFNTNGGQAMEKNSSSILGNIVDHPDFIDYT